jgi:ketosteroid isomerase-like protein
MNHKGFFDEMFAQVDGLEARGFAACFTEGGVFRFGNNEPVAGRGRIEDFIRGFFGAIGGISHQFENCWTLGERAFANGFVTYVRKDGSKLTVPWATISRFEEGKLAEYNAYVDASELFNPRSVSPEA